MFDLSKIRNFCIVAHIDHGKSTLADRLIESTDTVSKREMENRLLDNMDIERERGITIKLQTCRMFCHFRGEEYLLNLIDTPGHVDFTYEVSRSLAACEGALLVVDATQGVEAQTLTNAYLALDNGLEILPVINKIDLQSADPDGCAREIEDVLGLPAENAPRISAKEGTGIDALIERIITDLPAPSGDPDKPFRALIFDSFYDNYRGAISMVRVGDGVVRAGDVVTMMSTGKSFEVTEVGVFTPRAVPADCLYAGTVGYIAASVKNVSDTAVGDTITLKDNPTPDRYGGYKKLTSMVYAGIYAADRSKYGELKEALEKLRLNDASLSFEPEVSAALGFGCRCGFLGLLHMEIIEERLEREFDLEIVTTAPSVSYRITLTDGSVQTVSNPALYPQPERIDFSEEPYVRAEILTPPEYVGSLMELCKEKRGIYKNLSYLDAGRSSLVYEMPLNEIIYDFFDALKSRTRGYASLDYEFAEYRKSDLVRLDMLLNGEPCDALSVIVPRDRAYAKGRAIAERLKDVIPRRQFEIPIQAAVGGKVIARETVKAVRKDVLAKCYGGDITRKKKLLEKQKEGKKRMRKLGSVEVPAEAFASILKTED